jgi:hypothetical protein
MAHKISHLHPFQECEGQTCVIVQAGAITPDTKNTELRDVLGWWVHIRNCVGGLNE